MAYSLDGVRRAQGRMPFVSAVVFVETVGIWLTSKGKCEFPCVSTSSAVTDVEN
jgi:hypothetical protein